MDGQVATSRVPGSVNPEEPSRDSSIALRSDLPFEMSFEPQWSTSEEESESARPVKGPGAPSVRQVEEHELTHLPHRSWCAACVAGRSRDRPHKRLDGRDSSIPCVVFDYGFLGGFGDAETQPVQTARDLETRMFFCRARRT